MADDKELVVRVQDGLYGGFRSRAGLKDLKTSDELKAAIGFSVGLGKLELKRRRDLYTSTVEEHISAAVHKQLKENTLDVADASVPYMGALVLREGVALGELKTGQGDDDVKAAKSQRIFSFTHFEKASAKVFYLAKHCDDGVRQVLYAQLVRLWTTGKLKINDPASARRTAVEAWQNIMKELEADAAKEHDDAPFGPMMDYLMTCYRPMYQVGQTDHTSSSYVTAVRMR